MDKMIHYPTQEWIDKWIDGWMDKNPDVRVDNFDDLTEQAKAEWWDKEIDKGNPTPFDLTDEQEKNVKANLVGMTKGSGKTKQNTERKRKIDTEKVDFIKNLFDFVANSAEKAEIVKAEREITFKIGENAYSLTLTKHRPPKNA